MARISLVLGLLLLVALSEVYEVQGTFLLRHYLRKMSRRNRDFRPFACRGMLKFVNLLELRCPLKPRYKSFFGNLRSYVKFINSASGSKNYDSELKGKAQGLLSAISSMNGKSGSSDDSNKVMETLLSMGKTLGHQQESTTTMSLTQRKELIMSMAQWAKTIGQFVVTTAAKSGSKIDMSSIGLDGIDSSETTESQDSTTSTENTSTGGTTKTQGTSTTTGGDSTTTGSAPSEDTPTTDTPTTDSPTSGCTSPKNDCPNGGTTIKGSVNFQHSGKATQSRQTISSQTQQGVTTAGSN
ncbi:hypothetical protein CARUB_v10018858mg [Capsella rubella]|uniref:DUF1216 domain-containing protein n=1 Tax=Capsella rubella TaxID=81985 RepID=R0H886_9BRAS|nr:putative protein TPRXL [Capsella rubella]EOA25514.1 hypothetical protein CARUB_v10018858mg [Capsella rubella]